MALSEDEATKIATDAYIFGYPLVTLEMTRRVTTNTVAAVPGRAPMNQFITFREFPPITYRDVPGANVDTLYSAAWLDLSNEPYVLSVPDSTGYYFMMPMLDGWSNVFQSPGSRTTGTKPAVFLISGPHWQGVVPKGVIHYTSATDLVWILGRTYCDGTPEGYEKVHAFQDKLSLVPLSAYGKTYTPPAGRVDPTVDMQSPTRRQVVDMNAAAYFKLLAALMKDNPPTGADSAIVAEMSKIGLVPGMDWDISSLAPDVASGVAAAPKAALAAMQSHSPKSGKIVNGWQITSPTGAYGTDYIQRALLNYQGPGWNLAEDAVYPSTTVDVDAKPFDGGSAYVLHFAKGEFPPVNGFWSVTLYGTDGFFAPNALNRVSLSQRDTLTVNADGSLDLYVQHASPGTAKESNWLPAPDGNFILFMRLYWPKENAPSILNGSWQPPGVKRIS